MALYCKKCRKELKYVSLMTEHVITCWGDSRLQGPFSKDVWDNALAHPGEMAENYFTTVNPAKLELKYPEARDVIWEALFHPGVRPSVQEELTGFLHNENRLREFDWRNFKARLDISGTVANERVFYRKMSQGEWDASQESPGSKLDAAFKYTPTENYRLWMSSSLAKVQAFGNEASTDAAGIIAKIEFHSSPLAQFDGSVEAHQKQGVQNSPGIVAIHREGFAEIGAMSTNTHRDEVIKSNPMLDYNISFTSSHSVNLGRLLKSFARA